MWIEIWRVEATPLAGEGWAWDGEGDEDGNWLGDVDLLLNSTLFEDDGAHASPKLNLRRRLVRVDTESGDGGLDLRALLRRASCRVGEGVVVCGHRAIGSLHLTALAAQSARCRRARRTHRQLEAACWRAGGRRVKGLPFERTAISLANPHRQVGREHLEGRLPIAEREAQDAGKLAGRVAQLIGARHRLNEDGVVFIVALGRRAVDVA